MKNMNYLKIAATGTAAFLISTATGFTVMAGAPRGLGLHIRQRRDGNGL